MFGAGTSAHLKFLNLVTIVMLYVSIYLRILLLRAKLTLSGADLSFLQKFVDL
jgi:hypothetical protein